MVLVEFGRVNNDLCYCECDITRTKFLLIFGITFFDKDIFYYLCKIVSLFRVHNFLHFVSKMIEIVILQLHTYTDISNLKKYFARFIYLLHDFNFYRHLIRDILCQLKFKDKI